MRARRRGFGSLVLLVLAAFVAACGGPGGEPSDLERFDNIDLGELAGSDAHVGVTRSHLLPVVVTEKGRGETSLSIVDSHAGTVTDAGPIPVDGWVTNVYPHASVRDAAMIVNVCNEEPYEGDGGDECGEGMPSAVHLAVYDIENDSWATVPIDAASNQDVVLVDVDGATATLNRPSGLLDDPGTWATVKLDEPLELGEFTAAKPATRPNGLATSQGHIDGFGWKASDTGGGDVPATWTGPVDGAEQTITIEFEGKPARHMYGAGECLVIATSRPHHLDYLHRLCTS